MDIRQAMDVIHRAQREQIRQHASKPISYRGPHYGVHVRRWRTVTGGWEDRLTISIECDPGYCGIGAGLTSTEARGLAGALLRAADAAEIQFSVAPAIRGEEE